jgi:hypothetical protein
VAQEVSSAFGRCSFPCAASISYELVRPSSPQFGAGFRADGVACCCHSLTSAENIPSSYRIGERCDARPGKPHHSRSREKPRGPSFSITTVSWCRSGPLSESQKPSLCWPFETRPERFELPTFGSVDRRSIQLSYGRLVARHRSGQARMGGPAPGKHLAPRRGPVGARPRGRGVYSRPNAVAVAGAAGEGPWTRHGALPDHNFPRRVRRERAPEPAGPGRTGPALLSPSPGGGKP